MLFGPHISNIIKVLVFLSDILGSNCIETVCTAATEDCGIEKTDLNGIT